MARVDLSGDERESSLKGGAESRSVRKTALLVVAVGAFAAGGYLIYDNIFNAPQAGQVVSAVQLESADVNKPVSNTPASSTASAQSPSMSPVPAKPDKIAAPVDAPSPGARRVGGKP